MFGGGAGYFLQPGYVPAGYGDPATKAKIDARAKLNDMYWDDVDEQKKRQAELEKDAQGRRGRAAGILRPFNPDGGFGINDVPSARRTLMGA